MRRKNSKPEEGKKVSQTSANPRPKRESGIRRMDKGTIGRIKRFFHGISEDFRAFDFRNTSEKKVLKAHYISFYKKVFVFRTNLKRSGSLGAIFLTRRIFPGENLEDVLRHEFGHTLQRKQLKTTRYLFCIGLPSWRNWGTGDYYAKPWEITADIYGGVQSREHSQSDIETGFAYLRVSRGIGSLVWLLVETKKKKGE